MFKKWTLLLALLDTCTKEVLTNEQHSAILEKVGTEKVRNQRLTGWGSKWVEE